MERNILFIGIGQTGCTAAELFARNLEGEELTCCSFALDTDQRTLAGLACAQPVPLLDGGDLASVIEELGADELKSWFPCDPDRDCADFVKHLDMQTGANQWRTKALLSFASFLSKEDCRARLESALADLESPVELYVAASLAGGTGAGLLLPVTLYLKDLLASLGKEISFSAAFLTLPDIYEQRFSSEQLIKSRANAYTALRELHAVNLTTITATPTPLTIGDEKGPLAPLFDGQSPAFASPDRAPFDRVFLFERVPGVFSIEAHTAILADTMLSFCQAPSKAGRCNRPLQTTSVFGGISLTKVRYPRNSILKYIIKQQIYHTVTNELIPLYAQVSRTVALRRRQAHLDRLPQPPELPTFCQVLLETTRDVIDRYGHAGALIGRMYEEDQLDCLPEDLLPATLRDDLTSALRAPFEENIPADRPQDSTAIIAAARGKRPAPRQEMMMNTIRAVRDYLSAYYKHGVALLTESKEDILEELTCIDTDPDFSLCQNLLMENDQHLHPVYALIRLCYLYLILSEDLAKNTLPPICCQDDRLPAELLRVAEEPFPRTRYAKGGENRLRTLLQALDGTQETPEVDASVIRENAKLLRRLSDDETLLFFDLDAAVGAMGRAFVIERKKMLLKTLTTLIDHYRHIFGWLCHGAEDLAADVRLCALADSEDGRGVVNIGASVEEKRALYDRYLAEYQAVPAAAVEDDDTVGVCFRVIATNLSLGLESLYDGMELVYERRLADSDCYHTDIHTNILDAILTVTGRRRGIRTVSDGRIFVGKNIPLAMGPAATHADRRAMYHATTAILPGATKRALSSLSDTTPEAFVESLMYNAGEYRGTACFSDEVDILELHLRHEIYQFPLYMVDFANDGKPTCPGLTAYQKAMAVSAAQMTPMWDPNLCYSRGARIPLPYISPEMQTRYEADTTRALLFSLMSGRIRRGSIDGTPPLPFPLPAEEEAREDTEPSVRELAATETAPENAVAEDAAAEEAAVQEPTKQPVTTRDTECYVMSQGLELLPVLWQEAPVAIAEVGKLWQWLYRQTARVPELAARWEELIGPAILISRQAFLPEESHAGAGRTLNGLWDTCVELLLLLANEQTPDTETTKRLLDIVRETLLRSCPGNELPEPRIHFPTEPPSETLQRAYARLLESFARRLDSAMSRQSMAASVREQLLRPLLWT